MSSKLQKGAIIGVVYFSMEKVLLYWSGDQYNNVQRKGKVARVAVKDLILREYKCDQNGMEEIISYLSIFIDNKSIVYI